MRRREKGTERKAEEGRGGEGGEGRGAGEAKP